VLDTRPCARDPQAEIAEGVPYDHTTVNRRFTLRFTHIRSTRRGVHYICTWLGLSGTLTTASAKATYLTK